MWIYPRFIYSFHSWEGGWFYLTIMYLLWVALFQQRTFSKQLLRLDAISSRERHCTRFRKPVENSEKSPSRKLMVFFFFEFTFAVLFLFRFEKGSKSFGPGTQNLRVKEFALKQAESIRSPKWIKSFCIGTFLGVEFLSFFDPFILLGMNIYFNIKPRGSCCFLISMCCSVLDC